MNYKYHRSTKIIQNHMTTVCIIKNKMALQHQLQTKLLVVYFSEMLCISLYLVLPTHKVYIYATLYILLFCLHNTELLNYIFSHFHPLSVFFQIDISKMSVMIKKFSLKKMESMCCFEMWQHFYKCTWSFPTSNLGTGFLDK